MTDMEARNILFKKLSDAVAWLDRELKKVSAGPALLERLTELQDDLAETLSIAKEA